MRGRMIGAWCASEWLDWMFFLLHSPFDLRHSDFSVAFVWFFTLIGCFPHSFFVFFRREMNDGWHFILYPSEFRDALGTPKPSLEEGGVPNKCTCLSFISQVFFPFSHFVFLSCPWIHSTVFLGSWKLFSLIKTVERERSLNYWLLNFLHQVNPSRKSLRQFSWPAI